MLLLAFVVAAIPVTAASAASDGEGERGSLLGSVLQGEESASDTDSGADLPGLIRTEATLNRTGAVPSGHLPVGRLSALVVIHQATRAPPLL
jgi:hypothetical protein